MQPEDGSPWLGIGIADGPKGVRLTLVVEGTPAAQAGLRVDDEILAIEKKPVAQAIDLQERIAGFKVGQRIKLDVLRKGRRFTVTARLAQKLDPQEALDQQRLDKPAPAFEVLAVPDAAEGKSQSVTLAGLRGKVVIVEFMATWCGPCKSTYPDLSELQAKRRGDGLVVLGISEESDAALRALATQEKLGFTLARDVGAVVWSSFHEGVAAHITPSIFVIDRQGVVRFAGLGAGPNLDHAIFAAERALGDGAD
jgi:peroxiredoxin